MSDPQSPERDPSTGAPVREHSFDGIYEFDNKLPNWWLWTFYLAIIFFVGYWIANYNLRMFSSNEVSVDQQIAKIDARKQEQLKAILARVDNETFWTMSRDGSLVSRGEKTYLGTCASCHGTDLTAKMNGLPLPGLPLNDKEWKHGGDPLQIFTIVRNGSPDVTKGMVAWEAVLGAERCAEVVAYILSHHEAPNP